MEQSWVASANDAATDFPVQNLPYGVFRHQERARIGIGIGDQVLDLAGCATCGLLEALPPPIIAACHADRLNPLMAMGPRSWEALRKRVARLLSAEDVDTTKERVAPLLVPMRDVEMQLPATIGDYTDFYASIHHATRVGRLFRPDNPLLPNYKYVPIGYHGRASSVVVSGHSIRRPSGQIMAGTADPIFAPSASLDYELEIGAFIGAESALGQAIPIGEAEEHVFGFCLLNDWSARDIQSWEYQPLGPFLAKSFATTISPWVVPLEAMRPHRVPATLRSTGDPQPLAYLNSATSDHDGIDLNLEVFLQSARMREEGIEPMLLSKGNLRDLYWTIRQIVTHHASNGCNLRPGDLLATGTVSGAEEGSEGCLLEMKHRSSFLRLPTDESREFLEDGDTVTLRARTTPKDGMPRIGFGECKGMIVGGDRPNLINRE